MKLASLGSTRKVVFFIAKFNKEDMLFLKDLFETGKVKPVVEQIYPLSNVAEAMRHLGTGHALGKIVVTMR
jgi:NADPH:quinone reductase-like Zn-dependent oxidoreductase